MSEKKRTSLLRDLFARVEKRQRLQNMNDNAEVTNSEPIITNNSLPIDICSSSASLIHDENQSQQEETVNKDLITPSNTQTITPISTSVNLDRQPQKNDVGLYIGKDIAKHDPPRAYEMLTERWIPSISFKFPMTTINEQKRSVCVRDWLINYTWLSYSLMLEGVFCRYCVTFGRVWSSSDHARTILGQLVNKPLRSLKDATTYLKLHERTKYHLDSATQASEFLARYNNPSKDVDQLLCMTDEQQQRENRKILMGIVHCLLFLAKQNLAIRGHDDDGLPDEDNRSQGNFRSLIQFRIEAGDTALEKHLNRCAKNAMYLSPTIQNELILIAACLVRNDILRELIEGDKFFSIIADETTDVTGLQQLSLTIRFLSKTNGVEIKEIFVGFKPLSDLTALGISCVILEFLHSIGLNMMKIRGQGYDGANTMSGNQGGVQKIIRDKVPHAIYIHCASHSLDLVIRYCCGLDVVQNFFVILTKTITFFNESSKRKSLFKAAVEATTGDETRRRTLLKLCDTRWVEKHTSVLVFRQLFGAIVASLEHLVDTSNSDTRADARAYLLLITDVEFAVVLIIVAHVFAFTKPYSEQLQAPSIDLVSCYKGVEQLTIYLSELQYDTSIRDKLFVDLTAFLTEHNISSTPSTRRRRANKTCREIFDNVFDTLLSNILDELGARFTSHQMVAIRLCLLLPVEVVKIDFAAITDSFELYLNDLPTSDMFVLEAEFCMWQKYWRTNSTNPPTIITDVLKALGPQSMFFPNIVQLMEIYAVLPVSIASAERSFSVLKLIKTFLRNSMGDDRLSSLALLNIHKTVTNKLDPETIVDEFAKKKRRIKLID
jgi:hypothetical protein